MMAQRHIGINEKICSQLENRKRFNFKVRLYTEIKIGNQVFETSQKEKNIIKTAFASKVYHCLNAAPGDIFGAQFSKS